MREKGEQPKRLTTHEIVDDWINGAVEIAQPMRNQCCSPRIFALRNRISVVLNEKKNIIIFEIYNQAGYTGI